MSPGEYKCQLWVHIDAFEDMGRASRWINLPFAPMPGLEIKGADVYTDLDLYWEESGVVVKRVIWMNGYGHFDLVLEPINFRCIEDCPTAAEVARTQLGPAWVYDRTSTEKRRENHVAG